MKTLVYTPTERVSFVKRLWSIHRVLSSTVTGLNHVWSVQFPSQGILKGVGWSLWLLSIIQKFNGCWRQTEPFLVSKRTGVKVQGKRSRQVSEVLFSNEWQWINNVSYNISYIYLSVYFSMYPVPSLSRTRVLEDRDISTPRRWEGRTITQERVVGPSRGLGVWKP